MDLSIAISFLALALAALSLILQYLAWRKEGIKIDLNYGSDDQRDDIVLHNYSKSDLVVKDWSLFAGKKWLFITRKLKEVDIGRENEFAHFTIPAFQHHTIRFDDQYRLPSGKWLENNSLYIELVLAGGRKIYRKVW